MRILSLNGYSEEPPELASTIENHEATGSMKSMAVPLTGGSELSDF
jgi:hypothetical protein